MKELADLLRKEREKKKLTLKEVAVATKINQKVLEQIESADVDALPAKPFLRGFIQTYARHLGLDVDQIMSQFVNEMGTTKPQIVKIEPSEANASTLDFINTKWDLIKKISVVGSLLILGFFVWFLIGTINKYEDESKQAAERKETVLTQVAGNTVNPVITPAVPTPLVAASSPAQPEPTAQPAKTGTPAPTPQATPTPAAAVPQQIIIEALDSVKLKYTIDDGGTKSSDLKPEQILTLKAQSKIKLNISDGGAVNIIYNGRDTGVPGNLGQPLDLSFPK